MVPSEAASQAHQSIMEEAHKDVDATAGASITSRSTQAQSTDNNNNNYWTDEDDASAAAVAATAKSLAERMQRTFPFAQSPVVSRPISFRLDTIMNTEEEAGNSSSAPGSFSYGNENSNQNSNDTRPQQQDQQHAESGKSSLAFILGNDRQNNQQQQPDTAGSYALAAEDDGDEQDEDNDWDAASSDASFGTPPTHMNDLTVACLTRLFVLSCVMCTDRRDTPAPRSDGASSSARASRAAGKSPAAAARRATASGTSRSQMKKSRICKFDGCTRYVVNRGLCIGHGVRLCCLSLACHLASRCVVGYASKFEVCHTATCYVNWRVVCICVRSDMLVHVSYFTARLFANALVVCCLCRVCTHPCLRLFVCLCRAASGARSWAARAAPRTSASAGNTVRLLCKGMAHRPHPHPSCCSLHVS